MTATPALAMLEEQVAAAVRAWDEGAGERALDALADHLDTSGDPDAQLGYFDDLVEARIERLAEAGEVDEANLYGAVIEEFYLECDLTFLAANRAPHRCEVLLGAGRTAAALEELTEIYPQLKDAGDPLRSVAGMMLGRALVDSERLAGALPVLEEAFEFALADDEVEQAAWSAGLLGYVCNELGRLADAARWAEQAAELWSTAGDEDEAANCRCAAASAEISLASAASERERFDECERHARRARELADGLDEIATAAAAVLLGGARVRLGAPREAIDLIEPALPVLRPLTEPDELAATAVALMAQGEARLALSDALGATHDFREALVKAGESGDAEIIEAALLEVLQTADLGGPGGLEPILAGLDISTATASVRFLIARHDGFVAMRAGDYAEARQRVADMLELITEAARPGDGPTTMVVSANAVRLSAATMRMMISGAEGHTSEAEECLRAMDDVLRDAEDDGEADLIATARPFNELWSGYTAAVREDYDDFRRRIAGARDLFLSGGATIHAALTSAMLGLLERQQGNTFAAAEHLVPAMLAMRSGMLSQPSSIERAGFRRMGELLIEFTLRAVAATGDAVLLAELLEELQSQSTPRVHVDGSGTRSLGSLLQEFTVGLTQASGPGVAGGSRYRAEQETILTAPPRIETPWNTIALGRYHAAARRYGEAVVADGTVMLTIMR